MKHMILGATASVALMLSAAQGSAATVVFDDFTGNQFAADVPYPGVSNVSSQPFKAGQRILEAENFQNNGNAVAATEMEIIGGTLSFSNSDRATGKGTVTYTNVGNLTAQAGDDGYFLFDVGFFDAAAEFLAVATDTMGVVSSYSETLLEGFDPVLFFTQFTGDDGQSDFSSLATLSFSISTEGGLLSVDGSLNAIRISVIPVPAAGLLLLTGVGALSLMRRKAKV